MADKPHRVPWEEQNPGVTKFGVEEVLKTLNAAVATGTVTDLVVAFTYLDPDTGERRFFKNSSLLLPHEMLGALRWLVADMEHNYLHYGHPDGPQGAGAQPRHGRRKASSPKGEVLN